jgi:hypothetical protein
MSIQVTGDYYRKGFAKKKFPIRRERNLAARRFMPIVWFPSGAWYGPLAKRRHSGFFPGVMLAGVLVAGCPSTAFALNCKPNHFRPAAFLHTMGRCDFDPAALSFRGTPADQARCLMRGVDSSRNLGPDLESLPSGLASRVGADSGLPRRELLSAYLSKQNLEWDFAAYLWQPLSRANDNDPNAPMARYFVIHDTSGPNYGSRSFPADIDDTSRINDLTHFECSDGHGKAHVVVNRVGGMLLNHELATPWRETKFELAANFSGALKGLFLHTELVQPRRSASRRGRDDALAPNPGFTTAQYERLALLYTIASVRAERWLIPAFHAALDADIRNGHDDPLNFDVASFAASLDRLVAGLQEPAPPPNPEQPAAALTPPSPAYSRTITAPSALAAIVEPEVRAPGAAAPALEPLQEAARESGSTGESSKGEGKTDKSDVVASEHCQTFFFKGHRRRLCRPDAAEHGRRPIIRAVAFRSVDRRVWRQGNGAWNYGGNVRAGHARFTP